MIYQLVKRDIAWKTAGVLACICPLAALVGLWQPGRPSGFFLFWLFSLVLLTLVPASRRCTSFEAALPIAGWDLYCARLLSNLILIWIPVFGATITILMFAGRERAGLSVIFNFGGVLTAGIFAIQAAYPHRFAAPGWWQYAIGAFSIFFAVFADTIRLPFVLLICAAASVALFLLAWFTIPVAFEIASPVSHAKTAGSIQRKLPLPPWFPILRALFPLSKVPVPMLVLIAGFGLLGSGSAASYLGLLWILTVWSQSFGALDGLLALPIPRHTLFLAAGISPLGIYMLSNLIGSLVFRQPPNVAFFAFVVIGVIGLFGLLVSELPHAHLPRIPVRYRLIPGVVYLGSIFVWRYWLPPRSAGGDRTAVVVPQLLRLFSGNVLAMTAATAVLTGILYWVAYRVFCIIEPKGQLTSSL